MYRVSTLSDEPKDIKIWRIIAGAKEDKFSLLKEFFEHGFIALGWPGFNLTDINRDEFKREAKKRKKEYTAIDISPLERFRYDMHIGDIVIVVYDRKIWGVGIVTSEYYYSEKHIQEYPQRRNVIWYKFDDPIPLKNLNLSKELKNKLTKTPTVRNPLIPLDLHEWRELVLKLSKLIKCNSL